MGDGFEFQTGGSFSTTAPMEEDIRHYLEYMDPDAPHVILRASNGGLMQALHVGECTYCVDVVPKSGEHAGQWLRVFTDQDVATELFLLFLAGDEAYCDRVEWRPFDPSEEQPTYRPPLPFWSFWSSNEDAEVPGIFRSISVLWMLILLGSVCGLTVLFVWLFDS